MRRFTLCDSRPSLEALGLRISPTMLVFTGLAVSDPLPDPEPAPGTDPGTDPTVSPLPLPESGPIGPGSS